MELPECQHAIFSFSAYVVQWVHIKILNCFEKNYWFESQNHRVGKNLKGHLVFPILTLRDHSQIGRNFQIRSVFSGGCIDAQNKAIYYGYLDMCTIMDTHYILMNGIFRAKCMICYCQLSYNTVVYTSLIQGKKSFLIQNLANGLILSGKTKQLQRFQNSIADNWLCKRERVTVPIGGKS